MKTTRANLPPSNCHRFTPGVVITSADILPEANIAWSAIR
jgi:hypothetical protein